MTQYLTRRQVAEPMIVKILDRLKQLDLLNDIKFARSWVETRNAIRPRSNVRLRQELRQKRIDADAIDKTLADLEVNDSEIIKQIVAQKRRQAKYRDNQKLMQYLSRQGFRYDDIKTAVLED